MNVAKVRDTIDLLHGSPTSVVSNMLRGFIVPEHGHDFIVVDWSAIESRVLAWLAGEEHVLQIYRGDGKIYEANAARIHKIMIDAVTKYQRQIGKVAELALGYQGGKGAFQTMAKNYGVKVSDKEADAIKTAWREDRPRTVQYWKDLQNAAIGAVTNPGTVYQAGNKGRRISYKVSGSFLFCQLPSGRALTYPYPKIERTKVVFEDRVWEQDCLTYMGMDTYTGWSRQKAYGGLLCENVVQASSRDLLVAAMIKLEPKGYPVVMHVHDEIVCEVPKGFGSVAEMSAIMCELPVWAKGLPVAAEGWRGVRYRK